MKVKDFQLEELKQIELDMLRHFISICNEHNLKYYLIGGTLLGAVRHKGFIPWDDDIDVGMPRPDYEKFLALAQPLLPDYIFLQTRSTEPQYLNCFAKLRNCNTTFIETSVKNLKINHGIYIDIFPLDGCCIGKSIRYQLFSFKQRMYSLRIAQGFFNEKAESTVRRMKLKLLNMLFPTIEKAIIKREHLYKKYDYEHSDYITNYSGIWGDKEIVPRCYFGTGVKGLFEGIEVMLPENYHDYLTHVYGDYMTPPPPNKQISHHFCTIVDTKKSYKDYLCCQA